MGTTSYNFADVGEVFEEIIRNVPPDILHWDIHDFADRRLDLEERLTNIRKAIDAHLLIRKPHLEGEFAI